MISTIILIHFASIIYAWTLLTYQITRISWYPRMYTFYISMCSIGSYGSKQRYHLVSEEHLSSFINRPYYRSTSLNNFILCSLGSEPILRRGLSIKTYSLLHLNIRDNQDLAVFGTLNASGRPSSM